MKETYTQMKNRQQKEFNAFPIRFAFSDDQLAAGMKALGLAPEETDKVIGIGFGGFIRRTDLDAFHEMQNRHSKELHDALMSERTEKASPTMRSSLNLRTTNTASPAMRWMPSAPSALALMTSPSPAR